MTTGKNVHITIDNHGYESPEVTTGAALYSLGRVKAEYDLFREVPGKGDDELIPNSGAAVRVHAGELFYSAKRTLNPGA